MELGPCVQVSWQCWQSQHILGTSVAFIENGVTHHQCQHTYRHHQLYFARELPGCEINATRAKFKDRYRLCFGALAVGVIMVLLAADRFEPFDPKSRRGIHRIIESPNRGLPCSTDICSTEIYAFAVRSSP